MLADMKAYDAGQGAHRGRRRRAHTTRDDQA